MLTRLRRLRQRVSLPGRAAASRGDVDDFLSVARQSFIRLQAAWDDADMQALATMTTAQLLQDLREQIDSRGPGPNHTEVLSVDARLLALEEMRDAFVASVEFSGLIRERLEGGAAPFRELWLLAKSKRAAEPGWQLARVQALG